MVVRAIVPPSGSIKAHAFRLEPNDSLKESLSEIAQIIFARMPQKESSSLFMMTAVGSFNDVTLRLANASRNDASGDKSPENEIKRWEDQRFECVSLVGTFSRDGSCHLHLSISDAEGNTFGGHLIAATIFTTCEVVLGSIDGVEFDRENDNRTGYNELIPRQILDNDSWSQFHSFAKMALCIALGFSISNLSRPQNR